MVEEGEEETAVAGETEIPVEEGVGTGEVEVTTTDQAEVDIEEVAVVTVHLALTGLIARSI